MPALTDIRRRIRSVKSTQQITKAMKAVAGRLRLDLAQYREMAAFSMFASDLDKSTQALLARGQRVTEILKQDQYAPLPVDRQVIIIFAGTNGYLDDLPVEEARAFEQGLYRFIEQAHPGLGPKISERKELSDELRQQIHGVLREFKERFRAEHTAAAAAAAAAS